MMNLSKESLESNETCSTIDNSSTVLHKISQMYCDSSLSDVMLKVGGRLYPAHRLILCASSEVFRVMLMKPEWSESCESVIVLHELDDCLNHFDTFLKYLYTGIISLSYSTVLPVLVLADKYNVQDLSGVCEVYMKQHLVTAVEHNCLLSWLQYCMASQHTVTAEACLNHFKWNFEKVASTPDFLKCDSGLLTSVLAQNDLVVHDEMTLYTHVQRWIKHQTDNFNSPNDSTNTYQSASSSPEVQLTSLRSSFTFSQENNEPPRGETTPFVQTMCHNASHNGSSSCHCNRNNLVCQSCGSRVDIHSCCQRFIHHCCCSSKSSFKAPPEKCLHSSFSQFTPSIKSLQSTRSSPPPLRLGTGKLYLRCNSSKLVSAVNASEDSDVEMDTDKLLEELIYEVMSFVRFPMMTPRQLADLLLVPLTIQYKEFFVTRMANGMAFHSGQWSRVLEVVRDGSDSSKLLFTPRLYTADLWSSTLAVNNLPSLSPYQSRTLVFSTPASVSSELQTEQSQLEWVVELYPKGVWFRKYLLIVWQGTLEIPEVVSRTVRLSVTYNNTSTANASRCEKTGMKKPSATTPRVRVAVLIFSSRDGVEFVSSVVTQRHIFTPQDCVLNIDDILPFEALNDSKGNSDYLLEPCSSFKIQVVISPLSPPAFCPHTTP